MVKGIAVVNDDMAPLDPLLFSALAPYSVSLEHPTATKDRLLDAIWELRDQGLTVQAQVTSLIDEV